MMLSLVKRDSKHDEYRHAEDICMVGHVRRMLRLFGSEHRHENHRYVGSEV